MHGHRGDRVFGRLAHVHDDRVGMRLEEVAQCGVRQVHVAIVRGTTSEVSVTRAGLNEWVRRLAAYGLEQDGGVLDGWALLID